MSELVEKERMTGLQANAEEEAESSTQRGSQLSGTSRSTIGNTLYHQKKGQEFVMKLGL